MFAPRQLLEERFQAMVQLIDFHKNLILAGIQFSKLIKMSLVVRHDWQAMLYGR